MGSNVSTSATDNSNKESTTLIWFDPNIGSREDTEEAQRQLRLINDYVKFYTDVDQCIKLIESSVREKIFLITSGSKATEILPFVFYLRQVDSIFIFCMKKERYEHLLSEYSKIIGIYIYLDQLCQSIQEQISLVDRQIQTFSFFDRNKKSTKDLSKEAAEFLWFQLFNYIINQLPRDQQAKEQMVKLCREYYRGNLEELKQIHQFEQEYESKKAMYWYSKQSFIYRLINKALRTEDIELLYIFRFFIGDLSESLLVEHEKILSSQEKIFNIYRGTKLHKEEFNRLKENGGKLISTNGYLSTSRSRKKALRFVMKNPEKIDFISVLFEIECNIEQLGKSVIFADITQMSEYSHEQEILFDLSTCFLIQSIEENDSIQIIKMRASNEGQIITKDYIKLTKQETEKHSVRIVFGKLMCKFGQYGKSQKYFEQLLTESNGEDIALIEFNIGRALYYKCQWNDAKEYYDRAYTRMKNAEPPRTKDLAYVLNNIGVIFAAQENHDEALAYYKRALKIREQHDPSGHAEIAKTLNNIGNSLSKQQNYNEALKYLQSALEIKGKCDSPDHVSIAASLSNIGTVFTDQGNFDKALEYYEQALKKQKQYYPSGHTNIAKTLICIGKIHYQQGNLDVALNYYRQGLEMQKKNCPSGHVDIANSFKNIGDLLFQQERYNEALDYYKQSFEMRKKYRSFDRVDIAADLNNICKILYDQKMYDEALKYYQEALLMQEKCYPSGHAGIAMCYYNIGNIYFEQRNYAKALEKYQTALQLQEQFYPSSHEDIGKTLNNIGVCYEYQNNETIALDYYQRALKVYMQFLPNKHEDRIATENNIRRLTEIK